ncbi:TetR/AcrR family transcriptional regulator [Paenibacillus segetis]|uniref:TetR family transcriptional regulator n=1 Tax=Paenibacillus segetis TaxID=1325360 RepID=A0ABQ1YUR2_9BACL|nr:TetR/AcrR family transcriptional regulator [Paenibacillus segetis]GGH37294.1 TetR family transcriptional regulator [Paenibacillus segetis]
MRERILQAVATEVGYRGLKFSIRDITSKLGISSKTLYQQFDSKESLVLALVKQSIEEMRAAEAAIREDISLTTLEKLKQALIILPGGIAMKDVRLLDELRSGYPEAWKCADEYMREGWSGIRSMVDEGVEQGVLKEFSFDLFVQMYIGSMYRLIEYQVSQNGEMTFKEGITQVVNILLEGICKDKSDYK